MNLFIHWILAHTSGSQREQIIEALEPPNVPTASGAPAWWTDDDDAFREFRKQMD